MRHRWIDAEDRAMARYIVLYDKPEAFRKYAEDFFISEKAVASRYYRNRKYIDLLANYQRDYEYVATPLKKWYERMWRKITEILKS